MFFLGNAPLPAGGVRSGFSLQQLRAAMKRLTKSVGLVAAIVGGGQLQPRNLPMLRWTERRELMLFWPQILLCGTSKSRTKFFRFRRTSVTWANAELQARTTDRLNNVVGQLATISSEIENDVARELAVAAGGSLWLGGTDKDLEGTWKWYAKGAAGATFWQGRNTGAAVGGRFTQFNAGEPNDSSGNEDGLELGPAELGTTWPAAIFDSSWSNGRASMSLDQ